MTTGTALSEQQRTYLDVLGVLHYVYGGFIVAGCGMGAIAVTLVFGAGPGGMEREAFALGVGVGLLVLGLGILYGAANLFAGRWLRQRRRWVAIVVLSAINCLNVPLGTLLGVFTIVVVAKDERAFLDRRSAVASAARPAAARAPVSSGRGGSA